MKYSLPDSANDILIKDGKLLMRSLSIYEIIRRFGHILRLTAFRFEDFTAALLADDQSALLSEIHIQLLRTLAREDRQQQTWLGPPDIRDAVNLHLQLIDHSNWPAALRIYLSADPYNNSEILKHLKSSDQVTRCYPFNSSLDVKLDVLEQLCDRFLLTILAREEIVNGTSTKGGKRDYSCRLCSKTNGDLITCCNCLASYHLKCADPTLDVPQKEETNTYSCPHCRNNHVKGVTDCISEEEKSGNLKRHEALGLDKLGRRYWFIVRRLFVVDEVEFDVRYYTNRIQFKEIIENLNEDCHERGLIENLIAQQEEIERQMEITESLYSTLMKDHKKEDGTYSLFLGQDGIHRCYTNNYSSNAITPGKIQPHDRDMTRSLNNKFCMTVINSFKWFGATDGHLNSLKLTVRTTLLKFESQIPQTFTHPCWQYQRSTWIKSVNNAQNPKDYSKALTKLETCIKPVLYKSAWYDSVGFISLFRSTFLEREELKKIDRQPRGFERNERTTADFEVSLRLGTMVKFSAKLKPVKHQVWKQKGEEYRLTGLNGWFWMGITRSSRSNPKLHTKESGLRKMEGLLQKRLDEIETKKMEETKLEDKNSTTQSAETNGNSEKSAKSSKPKLPPTHDFITKRDKVRSIFVLPDLELHRLARSGGMKEVRTFSYTAKQNHYIWPYGMTPRPTFRTCWLFRNELIDTIQDVALQLKVMYACVRWDDLQVRPPASGNSTIITDESTIKVELLKRRDKLPYLTHSEYLIRKTTIPNELPTRYKKTTAKSTPPARTGLRARCQVDKTEEKKPSREELWVSEYQLELWELKQFDEKIERQNALIRERALREEADKRRRLEEQKRRAAEIEKRRIKAEQDEATKRARLSTPIMTYQNYSKISTPSTPNSCKPSNNNSLNIPPQQQGSQTPTTPVLRYFRTEQGQIIRLPASYLQKGTPLILRHVTPGTNQTNTYIIRPQTTTITTYPTTNNVRLISPGTITAPQATGAAGTVVAAIETTTKASEMPTASTGTVSKAPETATTAQIKTLLAPAATPATEIETASTPAKVVTVPEEANKISAEVATVPAGTARETMVSVGTAITALKTAITALETASETLKTTTAPSEAPSAPKNIVTDAEAVATPAGIATAKVEAAIAPAEAVIAAAAKTATSEATTAAADTATASTTKATTATTMEKAVEILRAEPKPV